MSWEAWGEPPENFADEKENEFISATCAEDKHAPCVGLAGTYFCECDCHDDE
jgi:hypothetical protein